MPDTPSGSGHLTTIGFAWRFAVLLGASLSVLVALGWLDVVAWRWAT